MQFLLGHAAMAAAREDWPAPPQLGGPIPQLDARGHLRVLLWLAARVDPLVASEHRARFDRAIALAREQAGRGGVDHREMDDAARECNLAGDVPALAVARGVVTVARYLARGGAILGRVSLPAGKAAAGAVRAVGGKPGEPSAAARSLLAALDQEIMITELEAQLAAMKTTPTAAPSKLVTRAGEAAPPAVALALLADGQHGLLVKLRGRWHWMEGTKDDMLASVPAEHFEAAVKNLRD
jgi:hypothetical protein